MRDISMFIEQSHFKSSLEANKIGRIEYLPISWHNELHGDPSGIDKRLKPITLDWTPKLRKFANTTILDVLFYTSPIYCQVNAFFFFFFTSSTLFFYHLILLQTIISKVGNEINYLYKTFCTRNPTFNGKVSLIGHSLGSLIVFDILSNQQQCENQTSTNESISSVEKFLADLGLDCYCEVFKREKIDPRNLVRKFNFSFVNHLSHILFLFFQLLLTDSDLQMMSIPLGPRKTILNAISTYSSRMVRFSFF